MCPYTKRPLVHTFTQKKPNPSAWWCFHLSNWPEGVTLQLPISGLCGCCKIVSSSWWNPKWIFPSHTTGSQKNNISSQKSGGKKYRLNWNPFRSLLSISISTDFTMSSSFATTSSRYTSYTSNKGRLYPIVATNLGEERIATVWALDRAGLLERAKPFKSRAPKKVPLKRRPQKTRQRSPFVPDLFKKF